MHRLLVIFLLAVSFNVQALQSLRVDNQVLSIGDSAARVKKLLGEPSSQKSIERGKSKARKETAPSSGKSEKAKASQQGERWQYQREGRLTTFIIVGGKIARIEDIAR